MKPAALMCSPEYFRAIYRINPWMHPEIDSVDQQKAFKEWNQLRKLYQSLGLSVHTLKQSENLPDMVYTANLGFIVNNTFIKSNFKYDERKEEAEYGKKFFKEKGFEVYEFPADTAFEGQGDLFRAGDNYFFGWGKRSDQKAKEYLKKALGTEVIDLELINPYYYHLDTCFAPLDGKTVAINPAAFSEEGLKKIYKQFPNVILVGSKDNSILACNLVVIGKNVVTGQGVTEEFKNNLASYGFSTKEVQMSQFLKGGGSVKCLTLEYFKERNSKNPW